MGLFFIYHGTEQTIFYLSIFLIFGSRRRKKGCTYKYSTSSVTENKQGCTYKSKSSTSSVTENKQDCTYKSSFSSPVEESFKTAKQGSTYKSSSSNVEKSNDMNKGSTYKSSSASSIVPISSTSKGKGFTYKNKFHRQASLLGCWLEE